LTYPAIAETLGISIKTVETLMSRGLRALRDALQDRPPG
jgi:DNA-directed RNA polymerase specialized sigma24 family protein